MRKLFSKKITNHTATHKGTCGLGYLGFAKMYLELLELLLELLLQLMLKLRLLPLLLLRFDNVLNSDTEMIWGLART